MEHRGDGVNASGDSGAAAFDLVDSLSARIVANPDGSVSHFRPSGGVAAFTPKGQGGYNTPGGLGHLGAHLLRHYGTGWTVTFHTTNSTHAQGQVDTFNSAGEMTTRPQPQANREPPWFPGRQQPLGMTGTSTPLTFR